MDDLAFLKLPDVRSFILTNEHTDVQKLVLNPPIQYKDHIKLIADQVISRKKLKNKLPEWVESEAILPPPLSAEQASSAATSQYKSKIFQGDHLVDLTGGTGIDTLALATRFTTVEFVDPNDWLCKLFKHNQQIFSKKTIRVHSTTAEEYLMTFDGKATFFLDPSRRVQDKKVFRLEDCVPSLAEILPDLKEKGTEALIKLSPMIDIHEGIRQLSNVKAVHVVSVRNECKEVLFHLDFLKSTDAPPIICVNLDSTQTPFEFTQKQEKDTLAPCGDPKKYIYDANASILKAGAFNSVAICFNLLKIAPNTHFYSSDTLVENFPGRCFEILVDNINSKAIKRLIPDKKANVITKNYPISSEALGKKLKLKDGGNQYVLCFRTAVGKTRMALCHRVH